MKLFSRYSRPFVFLGCTEAAQPVSIRPFCGVLGFVGFRSIFRSWAFRACCLRMGLYYMNIKCYEGLGFGLVPGKEDVDDEIRT